MENSVIIYSPSCHCKPIRWYFIKGDIKNTKWFIFLFHRRKKITRVKGSKQWQKHNFCVNCTFKNTFILKQTACISKYPLPLSIWHWVDIHYASHLDMVPLDMHQDSDGHTSAQQFNVNFHLNRFKRFQRMFLIPEWERHWSHCSTWIDFGRTEELLCLEHCSIKFATTRCLSRQPAHMAWRTWNREKVKA